MIYRAKPSNASTRELMSASMAWVGSGSGGGGGGKAPS